MKEDPKHIAIIMDGNGRWAQKQGLSRSEGHKKGTETVETVLRAAKKHHIQFLTLYAFSTENWKRPPQEVFTLMGLLEKFLEMKLPFFMEENVKLVASGRLERLPDAPRKKLLEVIEKTAHNTAATLNLCLNYGGRLEIVDAVKNAIKKGLNPDTLDEASFAKLFYHPEIPDPDLIIRTSGELRLSNFLLWEGAYSEFYFTDTLWPDFDEAELEKAISSYRTRDRRFGLLSFPGEKKVK